MTRFEIFLLAAAFLASACSQPQPPQSAQPNVDERVTTLADAFLAAYFERNPDQATYYGVPGSHHDRLTDNSLSALKAWEAKEDDWLREATAIDTSSISAAPLKATYAIVREELESAAGERVCRNELWNVSQMTGWQVDLGYLVTIQPVGTDQARAEALARWRMLPAYVDTEIVNLREGMKQGYTAPQGNVRIVIDQMDSLISSPPADLPFLSPAQRDKTPEFRQAFEALVKDQLLPAFVRYRDFLSSEYLPAARPDIAVTALPNGSACYAASVRARSTLSVPAKEIHELGRRQIEGLIAEMKAIATRSFGTDDVQGLLKRVRTDRQYMFKDRDELIAYSTRALERAKASAPDWFGLLPKADVILQPYPTFREKNAPNEYNGPAEDGSRPAVFLVSAYQAQNKSKAGAEAVAFHETIPGHHLQIAIALERKEIHPIGKYMGNSGFIEGWALYSERVADEMKLYSSDLDRLGMLSNQALRATRLVVDSGMHTLGWTRQQAIDYMLAHTTEEPAQAASEIDRYIIWPGQATAYMLGMLDIRRLRDEAQQKLGPKFDIKAFHDRVLEDGSVPLGFLGTKIRAWIGAS
jgi:uncharacterized protein (DUF885 family)